MESSRAKESFTCQWVIDTQAISTTVNSKVMAHSNSKTVAPTAVSSRTAGTMALELSEAKLAPHTTVSFRRESSMGGHVTCLDPVRHSLEQHTRAIGPMVT